MDRKDNTGMRSRPQQVSVPPPAFQLPEPQSLSEGTAVQVSEDDDCRSNSEYFLLSLDSNVSRISASSSSDVDTSSHFSSADVETSHLSSIFTSDLSTCEDDLEHDGETQTSVVSSPSSHLSSSSFSSLSTDFLSSISSNPCSRPSSESCSLASMTETDSFSDNMLFADSKPPQRISNTPQRIPSTPQQMPSLIAAKLSSDYNVFPGFNVPSGFNMFSGFNVSPGSNVSSGPSGTECQYPEYANEQKRLDSFRHWPAHLTQTGHQMAFAGFFYVSYSDWVRCFSCGIGVREWAAEDDPWVEHARWSPRCEYIRLMRNPQFLDDVERAVQEREQEQEIINQPSVPLAVPTRVAEDVSDTCVKSSNPQTVEEYPEKTLEKNPLLTDAAQSVLNMGFLPKQVKRAVDVVLRTKTWQTMTAEDIVDVLTEIDQESTVSDSSSSQEAETRNECLTGDMEKLKERNEDLKERTLCKMCCIEKVSIVFLPCGHLVSCGQCSPALRKCPMCRKEIKGTVRVKFN